MYLFNILESRLVGSGLSTTRYDLTWTEDPSSLSHIELESGVRALSQLGHVLLHFADSLASSSSQHCLHSKSLVKSNGNVWCSQESGSQDCDITREGHLFCSFHHLHLVHRVHSGLARSTQSAPNPYRVYLYSQGGEGVKPSKRWPTQLAFSRRPQLQRVSCMGVMPISKQQDISYRLAIPLLVSMSLLLRLQTLMCDSSQFLPSCTCLGLLRW